MTLDIQEEEEITLRQTSYLLQIHARLPGKGPTMTAGYLRLQLTDLSTQHVYTGEYSSDYVEEIAMKTGNFKRFVVFVEMVVSAMKQTTKTVQLDLLTHQDLQLLRKSTATPPAAATAAAAAERTKEDGDEKRYLILTYAVAFDRVHYPLPLKLQRSSTAMDPLIVGDLQRELNELRLERQEHVDRISQVLRENDQLKHQLKYQHSSISAAANGTPRRQLEADKDLVLENLKLKREIERLTQDRKQVEQAFNQLRDETRHEFHSIQKDVRHLAKELSSSGHQHDRVDYQLNRCYQLIEQLLEELKSEKEKVQQVRAERQLQVRQLKEELQRLRTDQLTTGRSIQSRKRELRPQTIGGLSSYASPTTAHLRRSVNASVPSRPRSSTSSVTSSRGVLDRRSAASSPARSQRSDVSTPFKRFDPTAYIRDRQARLTDRRSKSVGSRASSVESLQRQRSVRGNEKRVTPVVEKRSPAFSTTRGNPSNTSLQRPRFVPVPKDLLEQKRERGRRHQTVQKMSEKLRSLSVQDVDSRLNVLQAYFDSLRDE